MPKSGPNIWYVHPYAGGPGVGRYSRPYLLAKQWEAEGCRATVVTCACHHLLDAPQMPGTRSIEGVTYEFLPAKSYEGNGLARIANMLTFTGMLWQQGTRLRATHGQPDMIVASSPHPYHFLASHRLARKFDAVSILEVRDLWPLSLIELAGVSARHPLVVATSALEKYSYRHADGVASLLPETYPHMKALGLEHGQWRYIPNGIDASELSHQDVESEPLSALRKWRAEGKRTVLYAGAIGEPNNIGILLETARRTASSDARFLIVGRGSQFDELNRAIADGGLGSIVKIFPQVSKEAALTLMRNADIGFISLLSKEIFRFGISPNKMFDYMHAGLPIVCAIRAGNDPVSEANCGLTVAPDSAEEIAGAVDELLSLPLSALQALGENGTRYIQTHHDYAKLARDYLSLYHQIKSRPH